MYFRHFGNVTALPPLVLLEGFLQGWKTDGRQLAQLMTSDLHNFSFLQVPLTIYYLNLRWHLLGWRKTVFLAATAFAITLNECF